MPALPCKMDFFRHGSGVPWLSKSAAPSKVFRQGPAVSWAENWVRGSSFPRRWDTGAMPEKIHSWHEIKLRFDPPILERSLITNGSAIHWTVRKPGTDCIYEKIVAVNSDVPF
jgi:hypothetical protein